MQTSYEGHSLKGIVHDFVNPDRSGRFMSSEKVCQALINLIADGRVTVANAHDLRSLTSMNLVWGAQGSHEIAGLVVDIIEAVHAHALSDHFIENARSKFVGPRKQTKDSAQPGAPFQAVTSGKKGVSQMNPLEHRCANLFRLCKSFVDKRYYSAAVLKDNLAAIYDAYTIKEAGKIWGYRAGLITRRGAVYVYMALALGNPKTAAPLFDLLQDFVRKVPEADRKFGQALCKRASTNPALQRHSINQPGSSTTAAKLEC